MPIGSQFNLLGTNTVSLMGLDLQDQERKARENEAKRDALMQQNGYTEELATAMLDDNIVVRSAAAAVARGYQTGDYGVINKAQIDDLAHVLFTPRADGSTKLQDAYEYLGEGTTDFISGVISSHSNAGADSQAFDTMLEIAKDIAESTGQNGTALAATVLSGYRNLGGLVYGAAQFDPKSGAASFNSMDSRAQLTLDATLAKTVKSFRERGLPANLVFTDDETRNLVLKTANLDARLKGAGVDMYAVTQRAGVSFSDAIGDFIAGQRTGSVTPGNLVERLGSMMDAIDMGIGGGRIVRSENGAASGNPGVYMNNPGAGDMYKSQSVGCDRVGEGIRKGLVKWLAPRTAQPGATAAEVFDQAFTDPTGSGRELISTVARELEPMFFGRHARRASKILAYEVLSAFRDRGSVCVQDVVDNLAFFDKNIEANEPGVTELLRSWAGANSVRTLETDQVRRALESHFSSFMERGQVSAAASRVLAEMEALRRSGENFMTPYVNAMQTGVFYRPVVGNDGRQLKDDVSGLPLWEPDQGNLELARGKMDADEFRLQQANAAADWSATRDARLRAAREFTNLQMRAAVREANRAPSGEDEGA